MHKCFNLTSVSVSSPIQPSDKTLWKAMLIINKPINNKKAVKIVLLNLQIQISVR